MDNDALSSPLVTTWDGSGYAAMGCGLSGGTWDCTSPINGSPNPVRSLVFWDGELYAGGYFSHSGSTPMLNVARWDGTNWQPLLGGVDGPVYHLRAYPDGLYVAGWFNYADTVQAEGLARWDGTQFHEVHDLPPLYTGAGVNAINDVAIYNGTVYIGGNFGGGGGFNDIAYFDGNAWVPMGSGFRGALSTVNVMEVRDGKLYIAGSFNNFNGSGHPDNPGNGIVTWDGSMWDDLLDGTAGAYNPSIYGMEWIRDTLHVVGRFNRIGGVNTGRIAKWDGYRWCGLIPQDYFYPDISCIGQWHDTLYVGGSFLTAGPDSINRIAKWVGGNYMDTCGWAVGVEEPVAHSEGPQLFPNPLSTTALLTLPSDLSRPAALIWYDALGRLVRTDAPNWQGNALLIERGGLPPGLYLLRYDAAPAQALRVMVH